MAARFSTGRRQLDSDDGSEEHQKHQKYQKCPPKARPSRTRKKGKREKADRSDHSRDFYVVFVLDTKKVHRGWRKIAGPEARIDAMVTARNEIENSDRYKTITLRVLDDGKYFHPSRICITKEENYLVHSVEDRFEISKSCILPLAEDIASGKYPPLPLTSENSCIFLFEQYHVPVRAGGVDAVFNGMLEQQVLVQYLPGLLSGIADKLQCEIERRYDAGEFSRDTFIIAGKKCRSLLRDPHPFNIEHAYHL